MFHFCTPLKNQKTSGSMMLSEGKKVEHWLKITLREKFPPYSDFLWSALSRIRAEYGEMLHISQFSVPMWENMDQKNSEYRHFSHSIN